MNEKYIDVLQQYDLDMIRTSRVRGGILCETRQGCRLLKEYRGTEARMEQVQQVLFQLEDLTDVAVDRVIPNREGGWITLDGDQTPYVVKEWNGGRECDLTMEEEVLEGVAMLASLHSGLRQIEGEGFSQEDTLLKEYTRHNAELRRARNFVRKVRHKSELELVMMGSFAQYYEQALEAQRLLEQWARGTQSSLEKNVDRWTAEHDLNSSEEVSGFLCHGEYSHHHILYDGEFAMVTDFMAMTRGVQVSDLYYFMRKAMEKQGFDLGFGKRMLETYDRQWPLTTEDRRYLYIRFLYPEKYWKQMNFYYNANKAWIPARQTEKIRNLERQQEHRMEFLEILRKVECYCIK